MVDEHIFNLVRRYQDDVLRLSGMVMQSLSVDNLFSAYRIGSLSQEGTVAGITYKFHGSGCYFKSTEVMADVDFGPNGRVDGFDAGKLARYVRENKIEFPLDYLGIAEALSDLARRGKLIKPGWAPSSHLFYFPSK